MAHLSETAIGAADGLPFPALVGRLVDDLQGVARAEVAVYKAKAAERANAYKGAAIFFGIAAVLVLEAIGALLVGLILTLATLIGPGWATLLVVGVVLAAAVALAFVGKARLAPAPGTGT
ncbi:phage holin family protein [Sphingomonas bacterium]|uniref:phage holin family protein n=1 Tax=Sphingomonas bacterium TaxID=1895847 RepID=UPI0020C7263C|nr:phage holin family protein [Sphingomonas bacterium]